MSKIIIGVLVSLAGPALIKLGFSEVCSGEITGYIVPLLSALPGAIMIWWARIKMGGKVAAKINVAGIHKS